MRNIVIFVFCLCFSSEVFALEHKYNIDKVSALTALRHSYALLSFKNLPLAEQGKIAKNIYSIMLGQKSLDVKKGSVKSNTVNYGIREITEQEQQNGTIGFMILALQKATNVIKKAYKNFDFKTNLKKFSKRSKSSLAKQHSSICAEIINQTLGKKTKSKYRRMVSNWLNDKDLLDKGNDFVVHRNREDRNIRENIQQLLSDAPKTVYSNLLLQFDYGPLENISDVDMYERYKMYDMLNELHQKKRGLPIQTSVVNLEDIKKSQVYEGEYGKKFVDRFSKTPEVQELYLYSSSRGRVIGRLRLSYEGDSFVKLSNFYIADRYKTTPTQLFGADVFGENKEDFEMIGKAGLNREGSEAGYKKLKDSWERYINIMYESRKMKSKLEQQLKAYYKNKSGSGDGKNFAQLFNEAHEASKSAEEQKQLALAEYKQALTTYFKNLGGVQGLYDELEKAYEARQNSKEDYKRFESLSSMLFVLILGELDKKDKGSRVLPDWYEKKGEYLSLSRKQASLLSPEDTQKTDEYWYQIWSLFNRFFHDFKAGKTALGLFISGLDHESAFLLKKFKGSKNQYAVRTKHLDNKNVDLRYIEDDVKELYIEHPYGMRTDVITTGALERYVLKSKLGSYGIFASDAFELD